MSPYELSEDPDDLGYFAVPVPSSSLDVCNSLLNPTEQKMIQQAAFFAHANNNTAAAARRAQAGYGEIEDNDAD